MNFYVYELIDPRKNNQPFYIGKGKNNRAYVHGKESTRYNSFKDNVIKAIKNKGLCHGVNIIKNNLSEEESFILECSLIKHYGRRGIDKDGILTNRTLGGEGTSGRIVGEGTRKKISLANAGKVSKRKGTSLTDEHKKNISIGNTGKHSIPHTEEQKLKIKNSLAQWRQENPLRLVSDATRKRMSDAQLGKKLTKEHKRKISISSTGIKKFSEEQKQKMSEARTGVKNPMFGKPSPFKGKHHSKEYKLQLSKKMTGRKLSEETKKKMSESHKKRQQI